MNPSCVSWTTIHLRIAFLNIFLGGLLNCIGYWTNFKHIIIIILLASVDNDIVVELLLKVKWICSQWIKMYFLLKCCSNSFVPTHCQQLDGSCCYWLVCCKENKATIICVFVIIQHHRPSASYNITVLYTLINENFDHYTYEYIV